MNILAFDTSTELLCGCLLAGDRQFEWCIDAGLKHAEMLMGAVDAACRQAGVAPSELHGIVTGRGPGSFTGLRIGMAAGKGMAESLGIPLSSVSALDAMAWRHRHWPGPVLCLMDARKQRFYAAIYREGHRQEGFLDLSAPDIMERLRLVSRHGDQAALVAGPNLELFLARLAELPAGDLKHGRVALVPEPSPRKGWGLEMALLGRQRIDSGNWDPVEFGPEYVRTSDAEMGISSKGASAGVS
jgi:tRNA threonylcarbamoyladenosine biosynthesis protein TsaB